MKAIIISTLVLAAFSASAATTSFNCSLKRIPGEVFTFKLNNVNSNRITAVAIDSNDEYAGAFSTKSKNDTVVTMVETLNGQGIADPRMQADRISFFGDSAGVDFVYFDLFKNSRYRKGFVRMEFNFGEEKQYSEVTCTIR